MKMILTAALLLCMAMPVFAEQDRSLFSDFAGLSSKEVIEAYGPPDGLCLYEDNLGLVLSYNEKVLGERLYKVEYYLIGTVVIGVIYEALTESGVAVAGGFSAGQMGQSLAQILAGESLPYKHTSFKLGGVTYDELLFDGYIIKGLPFEKTVVLENNRTANIWYAFPEDERLEPDALLAFAREVDIGLMTGLGEDAVWLFRDTSAIPWDEDLGPRRWSYLRFITTEDMCTNLITFGLQRIFLLEYYDRTAHGPFMDIKVDGHDRLVLDYWQDGEKQYSNSGNLQKLQALVEARAAQ